MAKSLAVLIVAIAALSMVVYSHGGGPEGNLSEPLPEGASPAPSWRN